MASKTTKATETRNAAPIVESFGDFRDTFDRDGARVSVELCHGTWCTFARVHAGIGDPSWKQHADRDAARAFARSWYAARA